MKTSNNHKIYPIDDNSLFQTNDHEMSSKEKDLFRKDSKTTSTNLKTQTCSPANSIKQSPENKENFENINYSYDGIYLDDINNLLNKSKEEEDEGIFNIEKYCKIDEKEANEQNRILTDLNVDSFQNNFMLFESYDTDLIKSGVNYSLANNPKIIFSTNKICNLLVPNWKEKVFDAKEITSKYFKNFMEDFHSYNFNAYMLYMSSFVNNDQEGKLRKLTFDDQKKKKKIMKQNKGNKYDIESEKLQELLEETNSKEDPYLNLKFSNPSSQSNLTNGNRVNSFNSTNIQTSSNSIHNRLAINFSNMTKLGLPNSKKKINLVNNKEK